ncbi:relaxase/mobilization nuclease domain-containing protein [Ulvibacterium marinum]|uniref:Mobilization protein n=1 Tax=Ulvibacterium marinum TaxID=2419782 RepID=A0A3B0CG29_9FLAO|nr:relaxase/mobilization nuclease domain-containing protein [Ulvibacterium marinum]RKN82857.1 mobilization protein [Ulvibacterium marinum]
MIGKGKSIAHTGQSMGYGWNQEKGAEVVHSQNLAGENAKQVTEEFRLVQDMNQRCQKNTLSFVLSPTKEDGQRLSNEKLGELTKSFIDKMQLQNRQAIAFVHRDKAHTHVHLYVNRIGFDGKAYNDSFIGKRSQQMAEQVALEKGLTTVRMVQAEKELETLNIRQGIKRIHNQVMEREQPKTLFDYMRAMGERKVEVIPSINKAGKLQGFRFQHRGHNFKGSDVHRSMSGGNLTKQLSHGMELNKQLGSAKSLAMAGKAAELASSAALKMARKALEQAVKRAIDTGIGY